MPRCFTFGGILKYVAALLMRGAARKLFLRQTLQKRIRLAEPGPLTASQVAGHGRPLLQNPLSPLSCFACTLLGNEKLRVVQICFRERRYSRGFFEACLRLVILTGL